MSEIITDQQLGLLRVSACVPPVRPCDIPGNTEGIVSLLCEADARGSSLAVFPELCITGYTCADLFNDRLLLRKAEEALETLRLRTADIRCALVAGAPLVRCGRLYNCAVFISAGRILGVVPKSFLPDYNEFYEKRWFAPGAGLDARRDTISIGDKEYPFGSNQLFGVEGVQVGVEICEDLWVPEPPSGKLCQAGAEVICNLSATDALIGKREYILGLLRGQSARCRCGYVYASAGFGESSTDLSFAGNAIICEDGSVLAQSRAFDTGPLLQTADIDVEHLRHDRMHFGSFGDASPAAQTCFVHRPGHDATHPGCPAMEYRTIDPTPFVDRNPEAMDRRCDEISSIQAWGLATRLRAIGCRRAVVGISGGLDSTLALLVTARAFDMLGLERGGITGVTMPGFGTTGRTHDNAVRLMELLGVTGMEVPIAQAVEQHFRDIGQDPRNHDITYENSQARERTQILMDLANKEGGLVIGTGDLSELALGWCTYNGDQMSMYAVNASVPKTMVRYLVGGYARLAGDSALRDTLLDIIDTPISPELLPPSADGSIAQRTEDTVGPYELHDFFLYHMMRYGTDPLKIAYMARIAFRGIYSADIIYKWLKTFYKRFFGQQFKRSCMPDGVKTGSICLSPRGDWRMPSDASVRIWIDRIDDIPRILDNDDN